MEHELNLAEMANLIGEIEGRDKLAVSLLLRQLRHHHKEERIKETFRLGGRKTAYFGVKEICVARLLVALKDSHFEDDLLKHTLRGLGQAVDVRLGLPALEKSFPPRGIDAAIYGIKGGQEWFMKLILQMDVNVGRNWAHCSIQPENQPNYPESDPRSLSAMWRRPGLVTLSVVHVNLTALWEPVLRKLGEIGPKGNNY